MRNYVEDLTAPKTSPAANVPVGLSELGMNISSIPIQDFDYTAERIKKIIETTLD